MKTLITMIAMLLILSAQAQEFNTIALDDFGCYLLKEDLREIYNPDIFIIPTPDYYEQPLMIRPAYWDPYFVPAQYDYNSYQQYMHPVYQPPPQYQQYMHPVYYPQPQHSELFYSIMEMLKAQQ